jgi:sirohydrochlorin ferrochelatase
MALNQAAALDEEIAVVTPMLMRGGSHAEQEIPALIAAAQKRHPHKRIRYAWPFQTEHIARFLAEHLNPVASNASISRSA